MRTGHLYAALALTAGLLPLAVVCARSRPVDGLVALELGGVVTTSALVCLAVGLQSSTITSLALVTAVTSFAGGLVLTRFLDREP